MIRILVADDEKLIRAGLVKTIRDAFSGAAAPAVPNGSSAAPDGTPSAPNDSSAATPVSLEFLEAKNGQEALELVRTRRPPILITDIKMPVMDGIELMNRLREEEFRPQIIVLSGFDDFAFAKAAIQNGALTYILKPVDRKELVSAVNQAVAAITREEKRRTEELLKSAMKGGLRPPRQDGAAFDFAQGAYYVSVRGPGCRQAAASVLEKHGYYVVEEKDGSVDLLYAYTGREVSYPEEILDTLLVGVSGKGTNLSQLHGLRKQSAIALLQSFFDRKTGQPLGRRANGIYFFGGDDPAGQKSADDAGKADDLGETEEKYERLASSLNIAGPQEIQAKVRDFISFSTPSARANARRLSFIHAKLVADLFVRYAPTIEADIYLPSKTLLVEDFAPHANLASWTSCVTDVLIYLGELLKQDTSEHPYIAEAIAYMKGHFTKNINMAMVANQVSVNYTWFSEKFKEHTGVNFNEYLKRLRLDEAKRLLRKNCYKIYEVAERSGFSDEKYFMKLFRSATGMSPSEWAAKHGD